MKGSITVYDPRATDFTHNGLGLLQNITCAEIMEELNGTYRLEVDCIRDNIGVIETSLIKAVDGTGSTWQLFRVYAIQKDIRGHLRFHARHITYDMAGHLVNRVHLRDATCAEVLAQLTQEAVPASPFTLSSDMPDILPEILLENISLLEAVTGRNGLLGLFGGELFRDNHTIALRQRIGQDTHVRIAYGKNLKGVHFDVDFDEVATVVKPIGAGRDLTPLELPELFVFSPNHDKYFMPLYRVLSFSDVRVGPNAFATPAEAHDELRRRAQAFFDAGGDKPRINVKIDFWQDGETLNIGDTVTVEHEQIGVHIRARVVKRTTCLIRGRLTKIEVGEVKRDIGDIISGGLSGLSAQTTGQGRALWAEIGALQG